MAVGKTISSLISSIDPRAVITGGTPTASGSKTTTTASKANPNVYSTTVNGKTYTVDPASQGGYLKAFGQYETDRTNQLNATKAQLDKTLQQNNATTNANYDNAARQAYVQYMQRQRALPSQLHALGVSGGATESGLLNLYNNYGNVHAANEQQRAADLTANQNSRDDAYNSAYQAYLSDLNEQKQQAISNQINEYNNEITRFSSTVAQYPTTEKGYQSYKKWIEKMKNSNDPLKDMKVALIRQQMASQFPEGAPKSKSSGGGGGGNRRSGYSGYRGGGSGSSGNNNTISDFNDAVNNTQKRLRNAFSGRASTSRNSFARGIARGSSRVTANASSGVRWR